MKKLHNRKLPDKLFKDKTFEFKGEVNTEYKADSIIENFKRILGYYESKNMFDVHNKKGAFALTVNEITYPLYIQVVPYRNGNKVIYSSNIKYSIDSENQPILSKEIINKMHEKIKTVIND